MKELTFLELAHRVIGGEQRPLSHKEIWTIAQNSGYDVLVASTGETPDATLYGALFKDTKKGNSRFCRVSSKPIRWCLRSLPSATEGKTHATLLEGGASYVTANKYERNQDARHQCLKYYGKQCQVCQNDLAAIYREHGPNIIQVHHIKPLASIGKQYEVNPITDLIPVCPNCHALIHRRKPAFTIEEARSMLVQEP